MDLTASARCFPVDSTFEVLIHHIEDDVLWVMPQSDLPIMEVISNVLNSPGQLNSNSAKGVFNPVVNQVVSAKNTDGTWYRARILSSEPEILVHFIDYGDNLVVSADQILTLPPYLLTIQPLAIKVKLHPDCRAEPIVGSCVLVRHVSSDNSEVLVNIIMPDLEIMTPDSTIVLPTLCKDPDSLLGQESRVSKNYPTEDLTLPSCEDSQLPTTTSSDNLENLTICDSIEDCVPVENSRIQCISALANASSGTHQPSIFPSILPASYIENSEVDELKDPKSTAADSENLHQALTSSKAQSENSLQAPLKFLSLHEESVRVGSVLDPISMSANSSDFSSECISNSGVSLKSETSAAQNLGDVTPNFETSTELNEEEEISAAFTPFVETDDMTTDSVPAAIDMTPELGSSIELKEGEEISAALAPSVETFDMTTECVSAAVIQLEGDRGSCDSTPIAGESCDLTSMFGSDSAETHEAEILSATASNQENTSDITSELGTCAELEEELKISPVLTLSGETCGMTAEFVSAPVEPKGDGMLPGSTSDAGDTCDLTSMLVSDSAESQEAEILSVTASTHEASDLPSELVPASSELQAEEILPVLAINTKSPSDTTSAWVSALVKLKGERTAPGSALDTSDTSEATSEFVPDSAERVTLKFPGVLQTNEPEKTGLVTEISNRELLPKNEDNSSTDLNSDHAGKRVNPESEVNYPSNTLIETAQAGGQRNEIIHNPGNYLQSSLLTSRKITKGCTAETQQNDILSKQNDILSRRRSPDIDSKTSNPWKRSPISPGDFKSILEFELSIIREQNRLQLLQLQKRNQNLASQIEGIKEDMAAFRNEVNGRLMLIHDSVINKMADIYSDISMLKNDHQIKNAGSPAASLISRKRPQLDTFQSSQQQSLGDYRKGERQMISDHANNFKSQSFTSKQQSSSSVCENRNLMDQIERAKNYEDNKQMHQGMHMMRNQLSSLPSNVNNLNSYPKMDHFDASKPAKGSQNCILSVHGLNAEKVTPDMLFNLFGVYGNVQRVKMSHNDKGKAYVEMADSAQANEVLHYLNNIPFMGKPLSITPCPFDKLIVSSQDFQNKVVLDFTKPAKAKLNRFGIQKWDVQKLNPPSSTLKITNVLSSVTEEKIKDKFSKNGFHIQKIHFKPIPANTEKQLVFVTMGSTEEAVNALSVMHLKEIADWMSMRITFARD